MMSQTVKMLEELGKGFRVQKDQFARMNQQMLALVSFYKEIEECSNGGQATLKQRIQKILQHHSLAKLKIEIPEIDLIDQKN